MLKQSLRKKETKHRVIALKLTTSLVQKLDDLAEAEGISRSAIIRRAVMERYLNGIELSTRSIP